jgi:hypothetical protein
LVDLVTDRIVGRDGARGRSCRGGSRESPQGGRGAAAATAGTSWLVRYQVSPKIMSLSRKYIPLHREQRLCPCRIDKNESQCDEQSQTDRKTQFLELYFDSRDSNSLKKAVTA